MYTFAFCHTFLSRQLTERTRSSRCCPDLRVIQYMFPEAADMEPFAEDSSALVYS